MADHDGAAGGENDAPRRNAAKATRVRSGTGLVVRQCLGGHSERLGGYAHPQVLLLRGMHEADPEMVMGRSGNVTGEVVAAHLLLGQLSGRSGSKVAMTVFGGYGTLAPGSSGLIEIPTTQPLRHLDNKDDPIEPQPGWSFFPLSVTQLEKGRIVSCNFGVARVPQELDLATQGKFTVNALQWAAGREVDAVRN